MGRGPARFNLAHTYRQLAHDVGYSEVVALINEFALTIATTGLEVRRSRGVDSYFRDESYHHSTQDH